MSTCEQPAICMSHVSEMLELAHRLVRRTRDNDLVLEIMALQGYLELSRTNPQRNYNDTIQKSLGELTTLVRSRLRLELEEAIAPVAAAG